MPVSIALVGTSEEYGKARLSSQRTPLLQRWTVLTIRRLSGWRLRVPHSIRIWMVPYC